MDNKLLLLGLLSQQQMHGYRLNEFIEQELSMCSDLKKPTAYYLLSKMAEDGWILEEHEQEGNRPPRKVFQITEKGRQALLDLLRENLASYEPPVFAGDSGIAFLSYLSKEEAVDLLEERRERIRSALEKARGTPVHQGSLQLVVEHQVVHLNSELEWLDQVIEKIKREEN